jgi:hypothetical protein
MIYSEIQGVHTPGDGNGVTVQELLDFLRTIPKQARGNYLMIATADGCHDLTEIQVAQSDQAEKWEFKFYLSSKLSGAV